VTVVLSDSRDVFTPASFALGSFSVSQEKANLNMNRYGQNDPKKQESPHTKYNSLHCFKVP